MGDLIDGRSRELLDDKNFCHVVTMSGDGSPHVTVVWVDVEGDDILLNGAEGRAWPANLRRDALGKKYLDKDEYPFRKEGEVRLKIRIRPEKVKRRGG